MSRHRTLCAWLLLAALGLPARGQTSTAYSRPDLPARSALARVGLERQWYAVIPLSARNEHVLSISMAGGLVFARTNLAHLYTYDPESGHLLWQAHLGSPNSLTGAQSAVGVAPSANSKMVFATNTNILTALDRGTGRVIWRKSLESGLANVVTSEGTVSALASSGTAADERRVVVGLSSGRLLIFNLYDEKGQPIEQETPTWAWQTNGPIHSQPILAERVMAFASEDGKVYVALNDSQELLYRFLTGGKIAADLGTYGTRTLLVPSFDNNVYCIDLFTGERHWTVPTGAAVDHQPFVSGKDVFIVNVRGQLSAVEIQRGQVRWTQSTGGGQVLAISPTRIYLQSHDHDLFVVDRATGTVISSSRATFERSGLNLRDYTVDFTNDVNDRIYVATRSGMMICLRELGATTPRPHRDPNQPPFGYLPPRHPTAPPAAAPDEGADTDKTEKAEPEKDEKEQPEDEDKDQGSQ